MFGSETGLGSGSGSVGWFPLLGGRGVGFTLPQFVFCLFVLGGFVMDLARLDILPIWNYNGYLGKCLGWPVSCWVVLDVFLSVLSFISCGKGTISRFIFVGFSLWFLDFPHLSSYFLLFGQEPRGCRWDGRGYFNSFFFSLAARLQSNQFLPVYREIIFCLCTQINFGLPFYTNQFLPARLYIQISFFLYCLHKSV